MTERYNQLFYGFDPNADLGINVPSIGQLKGGLQFVGAEGMSRQQGKLDTNNFGPRISAAYALPHRTVLRAGWGMFYEGLSNNLAGTAPGAASTYSSSTAYLGSADGYRSPLPGVGIWNPFPNGFQPVTGNSMGLKSLLGAGITFTDPNRQMPSIHQMQVSIAHELGWQSIIEAAYVGTRYNSLYRTYNLNDVPDAYRTLDSSVANPFYGVLPSTSSRGGASTVTANALKVAFPHFTSVNQELTNGPWGRYDSLQTRWEKRMSNGFQFVANYTWSKNLYYDPQSLVNDRFYTSVTDTDRTHVARMFVTFDLPFGDKRYLGSDWPRWLDTIAGGWAATWVTRYSSGAALSLSGPIGRPIPLANPRTGVSYNDCLGDPTGAMHSSPCLDVAKVQALVDRYAITPEPPRYSWLRGPGYADHDAVFFKSFRLVERAKFELRAETNNVFNTPQWGNPRTDITNPRTFGTINSGGNPRSVRFTGRLTF
jgi:hypothetical protein